jgi:exopolysaccharide biosynthesis protein
MLIAGAVSYSSAVQNTRLSSSQDFLNVSAGVKHLRVTRGHKSDSETTGPWLINLLLVDLKQAELRIVHALDEGVGLETTTSMATRYGAIAAVNAGFFRTTGTYRGEASGVLVVDKKLISEPLDRRASVGLIERSSVTEIIFGHLKFTGYVKSRGGRRLAINGLNRPRAADELVVYTPEFHRTTLTRPDGIEVIVRRNRIIQLRDLEGSSSIPADGFVISASGSARTWALANLRAGSFVRVDTTLVPVETGMSALWKEASFVVGGGPQLIKDGRASIAPEDEGIAARFVSDRHPRTAIAKTLDGQLLIATVDGRQPGVSVGMSLPELAELLLEFGALEAINLDGGGSTTMVVNGKLVNNPSDQTGERPVSDAILIIPRKLPPGAGVH